MTSLTVRTARSTLLSALIAATPGCAAPDASAPAGSTALFRADLENTGVYRNMAFEAINGRIWTFRTGGAIRSTPAVADGSVYFGSSDGHLYAVGGADGAEEWRFDAGSAVVSSPAVGPGSVYFQDRAGVIRALDRRTGRERWRVATGSEVPFPWGNEGWDYFVSSPVLVEGVVVVGAADGHLYALDAGTGEERWRYATEGRIRSSPAVSEGVVYVGSADGSVHAVSLESGLGVWRHDTEGRGLVSAEFGFDRRTVQSSPSVVDGVVYVGSRDGRVYALDRVTGERMWTASHGTSWVVSSPAVSDGLVISGSSDGLFVHAVDVLTGEERWRTRTASNVFGSAAIVGSTAWVGDFSGALLGLDVATGEVVGRVLLGGAVMSSPVVADGVLYVGADDGRLHAFLAAGAEDSPRRAVFWDSALVGLSGYRDGGRLKDAMVAAGYELVDEDGVALFMEEALATGRPATVVFALDYVPPTVAAEPSDTTLYRRFLEGPGRIVSVGYPPMLIVWDRATGRATAFDAGRAELLTGVDHDDVSFDSYTAIATAEGRALGLADWWVDSGGVPVEQVTTVFALDERGRAVAWQRSYGGLPGSGLIRLWSTGQPVDPALVGVLAGQAWR